MVPSRDLPLIRRLVRDIVGDDRRAASVFEHHGIEYCCDVTATLGEACARASADLASVQADLRQTEARPPAASPTPAWDLDQVVAYIVDRHHRYVRDTLPLLRAWCTRLVLRHGHARPELSAVATLVEDLDTELSMHLVKEEQILFPWLVRMAEAFRSRQPPEPGPFGTILHPIRAMEAEHERIEHIVEKLRTLAGTLEPPAERCVTWVRFWQEVARFDEDLRAHVQVEHNVLFARALELERLLG
jgi:regulator of cell morphogenesis and NO signaling